jgi:hypothetical protein
MKNFVRMLLPLALLVAAPAQAQDITFGVKGGLNVANLNTDDPDFEDITSAKTGFVGGAFATFGLGSLFAIQPELLYSQKGFKAEDDLFEVDAQLAVNYFEIPILLKAQFDLSMFRPAIYAGPVLSLETSCKVEGSEGGIDISADCDLDEGGFANRKTTDWGAVFGANLDFLLGPVVLILDARYQLGFTNLNDDPEFPDESYNNQLWQIMAGV